MNTVAYFEIQATDPEALIPFYQGVFGWKFVKQEGLPIPYWRIETEGIHGGLLERPGAMPPSECGTNAYVCSMEVPAFDKAAAQVERLGGLIALPKFAVPGACWQGYFVDPEGNTFGLFQVDEAAQ
ncbi:VOC family protein [Marinobacter sp. 71-i]|uniref:VOC family protein n=1 Tax=Marinobacter iranensis TaxID=2962607 RepID=A0ABT5Y6V5_9GAMM|nr:VOC family protein [Marinobacter iranensis]MDF0749407.1 VOC family protein [Marinobacter iranensis]